MTTIVLTIVGVLLAAAAALMVMWYGGTSFERGSIRAEAATALGAAVQIADAVKLKETTDGSTFPAQGLQTLVAEGYLTSVPAIPDGIPYLMDETGCAGCVGPKAIGVVYAMPKTERVREICAQVRRSAGMLAPNAPYAPNPQTMLSVLKESRIGCSTDGSNFFVYSGF